MTHPPRLSPVGIGLALVLGTALTYLADGGSKSTAHPTLLLAGVLFACLAILAQVKASASKDEYVGGDSLGGG